VRFLLLTQVLACLCVGACADAAAPQDGVDPPPNAPAQQLEVSPAADTIRTAGGTATFAAAVVDEAGAPLAGEPIAWATLDPAVVVVDAQGTATAAGGGVGRITATSGTLVDTAWVWVTFQPPQAAGSLTPANLMATAGPLIRRGGGAPINGYDARYAEAELGTYQTWVQGGKQGATGESHYGALRSRYQWSLRNSQPVGPGSPASSAYARGVEMTRAFLNKYAKPASFKAAPHNNTAMADVEMLYVLEGDPVALEHLKAIATYYGVAYIEYYFDLSGPNSDPRHSAILLQTFNVAERLGFAYTGRASWGSSWKEAAATLVDRMSARITDGKVVSLAHKTSGQGDEAFFMNAMLATELLRWHGFVEAQPSWFELARQIMDHLIDEHDRHGAGCLPYLSTGTDCANDLAGFYVWPALVLWQETAHPKYRTFALANLAAAQDAFLAVKQFNQTYSTGAQSAEALLAGGSWH
jgi:hypothetical protein